MALPRTRFSRKLHAAFATLSLVTLGLAWYFHDSVNWYRHDVQRISMANDVLQAYQQLSVLTFRELNDLGERVGSQRASDTGLAADRGPILRNAISRIRQGIAAELAFARQPGESEELEALVDIERVVEEIIRSGAAIDQALAENRRTDASDELSRLRGSGVAGHFNNLVLQAIREQQTEVDNADTEAIELAHYITRVLPVFMFVLVVITLLLIYTFSRSLRRSVGALHDGVRAFTAGNLGHRIPSLREREFWRLGDAFNTMAKELSDHRTELHDANIRLEATVDERTRALKSSNRKLANVDVNRRKLLADISHEFRTPLTVIRGESEIALRGKSKTKADYRESFQRIMEQADHTTRLVDDLLFIARVDAGEPRLTLRSVALAGQVEAVCEEFEAKARQKEVIIKHRIEDTGVVVHGDAGRLKQVFAILIDNALRYSHPGGVVEVSMVRGDREVLVRFQDNGIGLSEEEADLAFERFYRGPQAEEHARGTGLGLPVAKAIVEAHKGTITLEGKRGEGAVATVTLPAESRLRVVA